MVRCAFTHAHYACTAWYLNLSKKPKTKIQISQNKCILSIREWYDTSHKQAYKSNQKNGYSS